MTKEQLAQWLVELDENVLQVAIMYAENYLKYGVNITEKWETATYQQWSLEKARRDGYIEGHNDIIKERINEVKMMVDRKECPMRTDLGNCMPVGGFCFNAVSDEICEAVHSAYNQGFTDCLRKHQMIEKEKAGGCISENDVNKHYWQHPDADYDYMIPV